MPDKDRVLEICKIILWHFSKCIFAFYAAFYLTASISSGGYRIENFDPRSPFDFITWIDLDRCCQFSPQSKVNLMSLVAAYSILLLTLTLSVRKAHWLFVLIVTLIHLIASCIVMQSFPLSYSYWLCIVVCSLVCLAAADVIIFFVEEKTPSSISPDNTKNSSAATKS